MIDKQKLVSLIIDLLSREVENLSNAAKTAHADATNGESKAENKYDTRGLEASYLAGAQAKMASESMQNLACYKNMEIKEFTNDAKISLTALIELESEDVTSGFYFLGPKSGGMEINYEGIKVLLITPSSPMGGRLIGREVGDFIEMSSGKIKKEYTIMSIK